MEKKEPISNLTKAVLKVMQEVKGIDKTLSVGTGISAYKGVADKDVKKIIGESMQKNGLVLFPIDIDAKCKIDRWDETNQYGTKSKQSVFTEVNTKYLLAHESGESITLSGYGQGVDTQDKSAGKATTYALKYLMLYTFLVPTGSIDDADNDHSDNKEVPKITKPKEKLEVGSSKFIAIVNGIIEDKTTLDFICDKYDVSEEVKKTLIEKTKK
jgi:hypothetical protein